MASSRWLGVLLCVLLLLLATPVVSGLSGDNFGRSPPQNPSNPFGGGGFTIGTVVGAGDEDKDIDFRRSNREWFQHHHHHNNKRLLQEGRLVSARRKVAADGLASYDEKAAILASRPTSMWPPWPLSLLQRDRGNLASSTSAAATTSSDEKDSDSSSTYQYPSMAILMISYLRQRTRIWVRQLEELGSQVWFNLPPATPPLILLASIPRKIVTEDPRTGEEITKRIFPVFSNPLARSMIAFGLGMAVLSWSQQELKRKRKLTPLPLAISYESVSRVFLPPFLPEDVPEPELEALDKVVAASSKTSGDKLFDEEEEGNNQLSPKIRKHLNDLYETASNPQRNIQYYMEEWKRGRMARRRERAKIRRLHIFEELVTLQALKRKAAAKNRNAKLAGKNMQDPGFALVTGASEGIGRAIAVELARWEIPIVLVSRNVDKLTSLAYDLEACYGVKCCVLGADLSEIDAAEKIHETTRKAGITVDILVNNAGIAFEGLTVDMTPSNVERMVVLNAVTYAKLSQLYGLDMKRRRRGRILMVSSMAGLCNGAPNTAVYGATKAFGKSLSLSMAKEMEPYGVGVTCLLPGAVGGTQFRARSGTRRALCWSIPFYPRSPESVAHQGIVSVLDGDSQTIPGWQNRVFATIIRPIIPLRFEIMTVQAAFSPLRLPNMKDLFSRNDSASVSEEDTVPLTTITDPESNNVGTSWIPILEPRYKMQPVPRILKLPASEKNQEIKEENAETNMTQNLATDGEKKIAKMADVPSSANVTVHERIDDDALESEEQASEIMDPTPNKTSSHSGHEDGSTPAKPEVMPKQTTTTTVEVEEDVVVTVEKETKSSTTSEPKQNGAVSHKEGELCAPRERSETNSDDNVKDEIKGKPKIWNDDVDDPFSPHFWSDEVDTPFSSRLISAESLIESLQLNSKRLLEILSLLQDHATKNSSSGFNDDNVGSLVTLTAAPHPFKISPCTIATRRNLKAQYRPLTRFILPRSILLSLSVGGCCSTSTALLFNRRSSEPPRSNSPTNASTHSPLLTSLKYENYDSPSSNATSELDTISLDSVEDRHHNVKFVSPLLDYGYPPAVEDLQDQQNETKSDEGRKPILLYLPGFDGTYICPFLQFPELGTEFEVWCMTVGMNDRSTYEELKAVVLDFIRNDLTDKDEETANSMTVTSAADGSYANDSAAISKDSGGGFLGLFGGSKASKKTTLIKKQRPIYLAGESFGGILASDVALTLLKEKRNGVNYKGYGEGEGTDVDLQGLVLINPATCYDRSQLATKGPKVAEMPKALYLMGLFGQLVPLFTDEYSVEQLGLILQAKALPSVIDNAQREAYMGRVAISLPTKLEFMPPGTLTWRLEEWLQTGCSSMRDATFKMFPKFRTLIIVGENDKTLPSIAEAERLTNKVLLPSQTQVHVVEGAGHASTCGSRLDLAAVIRNRFIELQRPKEKRKNNGRTDKSEKRTSMKTVAQNGTGPYFGMEQRYDNAKIGLNPVKYWSKSNYRAVKAKTKDRFVVLPDSGGKVSYKTMSYKARRRTENFVAGAQASASKSSGQNETS